MTLVIAWVRKVHDCEELVFVSDSRLSSDGRNFDACPKILTLPRTDCAIAYAGYSGHGYPMALQFQRAIESYEPSRRRSLDISSVRTHALKIFDRMKDMIQNSPHVSIKQNLDPEASFVFGGYSWIKKGFLLWTFVFSPTQGRFEARPASWIGFSPQLNRFTVLRTKSPQYDSHLYSRIAFEGDQAERAMQLLLDKLNAKLADNPACRNIGWEPFEILRDMLRDPSHAESIGGAPQVVKVYQYMHTTSLGVFWPDRTGNQIYLSGRPCLEYERVDNWILDPDTLMSELPTFEATDKGFLDAVESPDPSS
jgi:hypothetical protein